MRKLSVGFCGVVLVIVLLSVRGRLISAHRAVSSAETMYHQAAEMSRSQQWELAIPMLDRCISSGGLNPDLLANALVLRAEGLIQHGNFAAAEADLVRASLGGGSFTELVRLKKLLKVKQKEL